MATQLDPTIFGYQNFYSATLTADITSGSLTISLDTVPSPTSGILVIDPDSTTGREVILYTSKGASTITCPSDGRGWGGSTAAAHLTGTTVIMAPIKEFFAGLADGTLSTDQLRTSLFRDYIVSGGTVAQSAGLVGTFSNIVFYLNGQRYSGTSIANKTYTASKDTYVDVTAASGGAVSVTYTEVANGAAAPALSANNIRVAKVVTNGSAITGVTQVGSDSLSNTIYPQSGASQKLTVTRQDDTTNTVQTKSVILSGWGVITPGVASFGSESVTFPVTFLQRPIVVICSGGDNASATTYGSGGNTIHGAVAAKAHTITTTGFTAHVFQAAGSNWAAGNTVFYQWFAIGEVLS